MPKSFVTLTLLLSLVGGCATTASLEATSSVRGCRDTNFAIYFVTGDDQLTPAAAKAIGTRVTRSSRCAIQKVTIVGMSDSLSGTAEINLDLSTRRAATVAEHLISLGVSPGIIVQEAVGQDGASVGRQQRPLRRRTEVRIDFQ